MYLSSVPSLWSRWFANAKHPLIIAVGGGNDSVSTLLMQTQLKYSFNYNPDTVTIMGMLPDCLDYTNVVSIGHDLIVQINADSKRYVLGKPIEGFPEAILAEYKDNLPGKLPLTRVLGLHMKKGSTGIAKALQWYLHNEPFEQHDLIIACDVGGDFIALSENNHVLSPQMDGYVASALNEINNHASLPILYTVIGIGTDGETPPHLVDKTLARVEPFEGIFHAGIQHEFETFYRTHVEPLRYSRTTDLTLKTLERQDPGPLRFRARMHTNPKNGLESQKYEAFFDQHLNEKTLGKFYIFDSVMQVRNAFSKNCDNSLQWYMRVQNEMDKPNHELMGQTFQNIADYTDNIHHYGIRAYFGTPSHYFSSVQQQAIARDALDSLFNHVNDIVFLHDDVEVPNTLTQMKIGPKLKVVGFAPVINTISKELLELYEPKPKGIPEY